jgi:hypothetical protein
MTNQKSRNIGQENDVPYKHKLRSVKFSQEREMQNSEGLFQTLRQIKKSATI